MRLIDADALKKCAIPCEIHNGALTDLCVPLYQIDNAPTVDINLALNNMTVEDIVHWCATHPDPEIKKQYDEERSRAMKMKGGAE